MIPDIIPDWESQIERIAGFNLYHWVFSCSLQHVDSKQPSQSFLVPCLWVTAYSVCVSGGVGATQSLWPLWWLACHRWEVHRVGRAHQTPHVLIFNVGVSACGQSCNRACGSGTKTGRARAYAHALCPPAPSNPGVSFNEPRFHFRQTRIWLFIWLRLMRGSSICSPQQRLTPSYLQMNTLIKRGGASEVHSKPEHLEAQKETWVCLYLKIYIFLNWKGLQTVIHSNTWKV